LYYFLRFFVYKNKKNIYTLRQFEKLVFCTKKRKISAQKPPKTVVFASALFFIS